MTKRFCVTTAISDQNGDYTLVDSRDFDTEDEIRKFIAAEWKSNPKVGINITESGRTIRWSMHEGQVQLLKSH